MKAEVGLMHFLFGCWHKNLSFPRSARKGERPRPAAVETGAYVVCLDCGKEFAYDWEEMRVVKPRELDRRAAHAREVESHG
ncbi:MAG TPA: hypothetical protein VFI72_07200 [Candidatus Angelobacter sp.]|nr:hypothetical protein [Candidatus Angelobacter sp.]